MTSKEIRNTFLKFFEDRGHTIVPSASVVPYDDPTLLFTNAGMNQFKDVFLGTGKRPYRRAVDTQKCIRVSGKHNDLEEVGRDTYHHTFFEMLGNWSFGDYYKKEAIEWSWELLTKVWGLPKGRLWATVYRDDDEAEQLWKRVTDIDPSHVLRFGEKDNFWEMGDTGPCGPCSEIHMDRTTKGNVGAKLVNAGSPEVMEIWNLVFIQYNRDETGKLSPLPSRHVDTGMGFERVCAVLQGKSSNYDTDVFTPLIRKIEGLTNKQYDGRTGSSLEHSQAEADVAFRVIADHIRTVTFAIGDGALPSNEGRGYVLRRLLRRASRFGRTLGMHEPFIYHLAATLVAEMSYIFPEIKEKQSHIEKVIKGEEEGFSITLDRGLEIFGEVVQRVSTSGKKVISGEDAFKLYDTFGFPLDLTQLMAKEGGFAVDHESFNRLLEEQRTRSREARARNLGVMIIEDKFKFTGYDSLEDQIEVHSVVDNLLISLNTPFYGESGGQVGDSGIIEHSRGILNVIDTQKSGKVNVHILETSPDWDARNTTAIARVDKVRRLAIMRNHTATHLVHEALRRVLGEHLHQSGSLVAPDHLRFDFNHFDKVKPEELLAIEDMVNEKIAERIQVVALNDRKDWVTIEEARKRWPNVKMFFGDKYGDKVRVVEIDPKFSVELCGGTHVKNTSEIGYFRFRSEGSVASGIRRIEAVTSDYAIELFKLREKDLRERSEEAMRQFDEVLGKSDELAKLDRDTAEKVRNELRGMEQRLERLRSSSLQALSSALGLHEPFQELESRRRSVEDVVLSLIDMGKQVDKALAKLRLRSLSSDIDQLIRNGASINGFRLVSARVSVTSMDELKSLGDTLRTKIGSGVGVLASVLEEKVALVCVVTDDLVAAKKLEAGKIVGAVAKLVGGGGGGRPHMAMAGGKDVAKLDQALRSAESIVRTFLRN